MKPTELRMSKEYIVYYQTWTWVVTTGMLSRILFVGIFLIIGLIPFIILIFLNTRILISLRSIRARINYTIGDNNPAKGSKMVSDIICLMI